jgi:uncharacterized protein (DUF983 family)
MKCPGCENEIYLSWAVYLKHPLGRFTCKECGVKYKFDRPKKYYIWVAISYVVLFLVLVILKKIDAPIFLYSNIVWMCVWVVLFWSIDRKIESHYPTKLR